MLHGHVFVMNGKKIILAYYETCPPSPSLSHYNTIPNFQGTAVNEPRHEKTKLIAHMRKQRRRSASQQMRS